MYRLSDNYFHRKCFLKREQVPTQSVMKKKMGVPLAMVYFKSMRKPHKVLAGLEPPLKGGGAEWFMSPDDLLDCKAVLRPVEHDVLQQLGFNGINIFGDRILQRHYNDLCRIQEQALLDCDLKWKKAIEISNAQQFEESSKHNAQINSEKIRDAFQEFQLIYRQATTNIELILYDAAINEIRRVRKQVHGEMTKKFEKLVHKQANELYNEYTNILFNEQGRLRGAFLKEVDADAQAVIQQLHDINVEKHVAIEKIRNYLECQNLACQIYVALKEREACKKEMEEKKEEHAKKLKTMRMEMAMTDLEISHQQQEEEKRQKFKQIWKKKICHVVKRFQMFVDYCLKMLPEHAEFFTNMEKLMMMQLEEASENPSVNTIVAEHEKPPSPEPQPQPFFLCCDRGFKPKIDPKLCPKHSTSNASELPVIVVNKRLLYAACDNFELYADEMHNYLCGNFGPDELHFRDSHDFIDDVPVKYTSKMKLHELNLESSLMGVLQQEIANLKKFTVELCTCQLPFCVCSSPEMSVVSVPSEPEPTPPPEPEEKKIFPRSEELKVHREPKWESYMKFVYPPKCQCPKRAKKHLNEHLPPYMKNMSPFDVPDLPNYQPCDLINLRRLVQKAKAKTSAPVQAQPETSTAKTRDIGTQWVDEDFEALCNCLSDNASMQILQIIVKDAEELGLDENMKKKLTVIGSKPSASHLAKSASKFATERAQSLMRLVGKEPELQEIFKSKGCDDIE